MYHGWRLIAWFLGLLLVAHAFDYLFSLGQSSVLIASSDWESEAWSLFRAYGGMEATYWLLCFAFFVVAGAVLASKAQSRLSSLIFAILLGLSFTVLNWIDGPRTMYSHAPVWLWALAWGDLYVPAIAGAIGVLLWQDSRVLRPHGQHAA